MNIPNGDMVGHTGDIEATVVACKAAEPPKPVRAIAMSTRMQISTIFEKNGQFMCRISILGRNHIVVTFN